MMQDKGTDPTRRLVWKWTLGSIQLSDLGNPTVSTSIALCVYSDDVLVKTFTVLPGGMCMSKPCWKALKGPGFRYRNQVGNSEGVLKVVMKAGDGNARIVFKAKGAGLTVPLPISQDAVVKVQLVKNPGAGLECWATEFEPPARTNKTFRFSDKIGP